MTSTFFHGSYDPVDVGTVMTGRGDAYENDWKHTDFYAVLEDNRPDGKLAHRDAVFLVDNVDDLDNAGAPTEFILEVSPSGPPSRHDMGWSSRISCLLSEGFAADSPHVKKAAAGYWSGEPFDHDSVWEYLVESVTVRACYPFGEAPEVAASAPR